MDPALSDASPSAGPRVLIADDSTAFVTLVSTVLRGAGCRVDAVSSGFAAVDAARERPYDCIVLDLHMPGLGGLAAAEAIRSDEHRTGRTRAPIVVLSADCGEDLPARCEAVGIDQCLAKSAASIRGLCALVTSRGELSTAAPASRPCERDLDDLLHAYIEEARDRAAHLPRLVEMGRFDEVERIGHQFHGSGATYGLMELSGLGAELEHAARGRERERAAGLCARICVLVAGLDHS